MKSTQPSQSINVASKPFVDILLLVKEYRQKKQRTPEKYPSASLSSSLNNFLAGASTESSDRCDEL
jgi:hypothetical protein